MTTSDLVDKHISFPFENLLKSSSFKTNYTNTWELNDITFDETKDAWQLKYITNSFSACLLRNNFTDNDKVIIICTKDNGNVLDYSLSHLIKTTDIDKYDILLVDDRSSDDTILNLSEKYNTSYLKLNNSRNRFNYSAINNIAATYAKAYDKKLVLFYNSDLWPENSETLSNLVNKHYEYNSSITGCKLLYPSYLDYENIGKPNHLLGKDLSKYYNTIQHGGISFISRRSYVKENCVCLAPVHTWRFYNRSHALANVDTRCFAVTGAIQIMNLNEFIELGGLNMALSTSFQDIDLCIRALNKDKPVYYIGTETMYHAESITSCKENITKNKEFTFDHIIWDMYWINSLYNITGLKH